MKLAIIRNCKIHRQNNLVLVSGTDKKSGQQVILRLNGVSFDSWVEGMPIKYALPNITEEEKRFLLTGSKLLDEEGENRVNSNTMYF